MEYIAKHTPETLVIVMTGFASTESVVEALRKEPMTISPSRSRSR